MKISTLIKKLESIKEKYGDLPIKCYDPEWGQESDFPLTEKVVGIDRIDNVRARMTKKQVKEINEHRAKNNLEPLEDWEVEVMTAKRPLHKPKYIWIG